MECGRGSGQATGALSSHKGKLQLSFDTLIPCNSHHDGILVAARLGRRADLDLGGVATRRACCGFSFYEWPETGRSSKSPMYSKLKDGKLMVMAGLWDRPAAGQETDTFAIVTVESTAKLAPHHERMPLILGAPRNVRAWLTDDGWSAKLEAMMRPYVGELESYKVTPNINNIHADLATFVEPVAERKGTLISMFAAQANHPPESSSPLRPEADSSTGSPAAPAVALSAPPTVPAKSSMPAAASKRAPSAVDSSESDLEIVSLAPSAKKAKMAVAELRQG